MGWKYEIAIWTKDTVGNYSYIVKLETNSLFKFVKTLWKERKNTHAIRAVIR